MRGRLGPFSRWILLAYICLQQVLTHTYSYIDSQLTVVSRTVITYNVYRSFNLG